MESETLDAALHALADGNRRDVLCTLLNNGAARIHPSDTDTQASLLHNHLPKLADLGFVEYTHGNSGMTVEKGPRWDEYQPLLEDVLSDY